MSDVSSVSVVSWTVFAISSLSTGLFLGLTAGGVRILWAERIFDRISDVFDKWFSNVQDLALEYRSAVLDRRKQKMEAAANSNTGESATDSPSNPRNVYLSKLDISKLKAPELQVSGDLLDIKDGINTLMLVAGENARTAGWHGDRPQRIQVTMFGRTQSNETEQEYEARLRNWQGMKIMLMVSELAEGVEELRKGKRANETYYPTFEEVTDTPTLHKPEGLPSELADTVIRIMDFCFTEGIDLGSMIVEKLEFNKTRGHKHGGKAI